MRTSTELQALAAISAALVTLKQHLEADLATVRRLGEEQLSEGLDGASNAPRGRAKKLIQRVTQLRQIIGVRLRTLERLRARMRQLRGGARPH